MGSLIFRNLPELVIERLRMRAAQNGRSGEAEGRAILEEALVLNEQTVPHAKQVASRLQECVLRMSAGLQGMPLVPSKLAESMNLDTVTELEDYLAGKREAPLSFLALFAQRFGVNAHWLKHGDGLPFAPESPETANAFDIEQLATELKPEVLCFVRSLGGCGEAAVVFRLQPLKYCVAASGWTISGHVGTRPLDELYDLIRSIRRRAGRGYSITGRDVPNDLFTALVRGYLYPAQIVESDHYDSRWWDDFTDVYHQYPIEEDAMHERYGKNFIAAQHLVATRLNERDQRAPGRSSP